MRNSTMPSGPGKPQREALDKTTQREGLDETFGQDQHSASSTDRQPNLERPAQPLQPSTRSGGAPKH
jgi:hypothetical protein